MDYPLSTGTGADHVEFSSFDNNGNPEKRIDGRGVETDYVYNDPESRLTDIEYVDNPQVPNTHLLNVHFHYDSYGRRDQMTDATGSVAYSYDDRNEPLAVQTTYSGVPTQTISYSYYRDGSRRQMSTPAGTFSYGYDPDGRMNNLVNSCGRSFSWSYYDNSWLLNQTMGNGVSTSYSYNARGFLSSLQNNNLAGSLSTFGSAQYDAVGNLLSVSCGMPANGAATGTTSYQYDEKDANGNSKPANQRTDQLVQEQSTRAGGFTNNFGYDSAYNRTAVNGASHSFNADNQDTAFSYDGEGNPYVYSNGAQLTWDPENRLTSCRQSTQQGGGLVMAAGYTGDGLRAWKQVGNTTTYFLYDSGAPVVEFGVVNGQVNVTAVNTFGATGLLSRLSGSTNVFYTYDNQGNVAQRTDGSGNILSSTAYDSYGNKLLSDGSTDPWGYHAQSGYYTDHETGLILCTHRFYDPVQGRWLNRDPIGYSGGLNLYAYVGNGPLGGVDPSGLAGLPGSPSSYADYSYITGGFGPVGDPTTNQLNQYIYDGGGAYTCSDGGHGGGGSRGSEGGSSGGGSNGRGLGQYPISHFTDAEGAAGISGANTGSMSIGETECVASLKFGYGSNTYRANEPGDNFVTELGADATSGELMRIGVFGESQNFVIQFSRESASANNVRISPGYGCTVAQNIYTIPAYSILNHLDYIYTVARLR